MVNNDFTQKLELINDDKVLYLRLWHKFYSDYPAPVSLISYKPVNVQNPSKDTSKAASVFDPFLVV